MMEFETKTKTEVMIDPYRSVRHYCSDILLLKLSNHGIKSIIIVNRLFNFGINTTIFLVDTNISLYYLSLLSTGLPSYQRSSSYDFLSFLLSFPHFFPFLFKFSYSSFYRQ